MNTAEACEIVITESLDLQNYIHNTMDVNIMRHMLIRSRHKLLMPLLTVNLIMRRANKRGVALLKNTYERNNLDRVDAPVFSVAEAVQQ